MAFIVNDTGVVYEKNLGSQTHRIAERMRLFDPDRSWNKADLSGLKEASDIRRLVASRMK
jgi:hypothetical protein